jgi:FkbM family methyltransferase
MGSGLEITGQAAQTGARLLEPGVLRKLFRIILGELRARFHLALNIPFRSDYGTFSIQFPANSRTLEYQRNNPKYDSFLPHLAQYLPGGSTVIDVGANIGDTLAAMANVNDSLEFICIEAHERFFERLLANIARIRAAKPSLKVHAIKALAGQNVAGVVLEDHKGSGAVAKVGGSANAKPLDEIAAQASDVRLIKSDVDGFDYDVIDSATRLLRRFKPLVFFECQIDEEAQRKGYRATFRSLAAAGYSDWTLFDNFGEIVIRTVDLDAVEQLLDYVWQQTAGRSTRTIYYFDVLAAQAQDAALIGQILKDYA